MGKNSTIVTHQAFFDHLLRRSYHHLVAQMPETSGQCRFQIQQADTFIVDYTALHHYCQTRFYETGQKHGLFNQQTDSDSVELTAVLNIYQARVEYERWVKQPIWGKGLLLRNGFFDAELILLRPDQSILQTMRVQETLSDTVDQSNLTVMKRSGWLIQAPALPESRSFKKWAEPVLAIGASSAIVFLFYFIRSQN